MYDKELLVKELVRDEAYRQYPYKDSVGKLTVGIGRNLDDVGINEDEARYLLRNDIAEKEAELDEHLPWWRKLDPIRQRVLLNMAFNIGVVKHNGKLLTFKNTLRLISEGRYLEASQHMLDSKWARQVGQRAMRLAIMMRDGDQKGGG